MTSPISRLAAILAFATISAALIGAGPARADDIVPGQVVVTPQAGVASGSGSTPVTIATAPGESVQQAIVRLKRSPGVASAVPNEIAHAADAAAPFIPNDPGRNGTTPAAWQRWQWNFAGRFGVNAPQAWGNLIAAGRPGGAGVRIAVLDTGVAYTQRGGTVRSPDLNASTFVPGYDFVSNDSIPQDRNGHGTHVASTIAEATNNGFAMTGLAYGARIIPVRVLDDSGDGDASTIARGVRYAVRRGAQIINMSLEFASDVTARDIPQLTKALKDARRAGVLVVAASGNEGHHYLVYPAADKTVLAVGATTQHGCVADFSNQGAGLDIVAPGGGFDDNQSNDPNCVPGRSGRNIFQVTLASRGSRLFSIPGDYEGTSMAAPHVSATAALVIASGVLGPKPTPRQTELRLKLTARDLGAPGYDRVYGAGLVDAARATDPTVTTPIIP